MIGIVVMLGTITLIAGLVTLLDGISYRRQRNAGKRLGSGGVTARRF